MLDTGNPQFTDFTVTGTLHVPSGTTIRCTGAFTNLGTIIVDAAGGLLSKGQLGTATSASQPGIARQSATTQTESTSSNAGLTLPVGSLKSITSIGTLGGGSGGSNTEQGYAPASFDPAFGGGAVRILAKGALQTGNIQANGQNGRVADENIGNGLSAGGGGGGGVIILASATSISVTGQVQAKGGDGGNGISTRYLAGGGGGGGLIRLLSPVVSGSAFAVQAGSNGSGSAGNANNYAAGGGGASAGNGGSIYFGADDITLIVEPPQPGQVFIDLCNPAALLLH